MSMKSLHTMLTSIRRAVAHMSLYPIGHPLIEEGVHAAAAAADEATGDEGETVITIFEDAFYKERTLLGHLSLEFNGLLRDMQGRGVESITFIKPVLPADVTDLLAFVAGESDDLPAGSTIRLNERTFAHADLVGSEVAELRRTYTASLDLLRGIGSSVRADADFGMSGVAEAVEGLLQQTLEQPGATLLLATVKGHDEYTFYHSVNTCILALAMGRLIGLDNDQLRLVGMGSLLHDIGKVGVAPHVLRYPGRLLPDHWEQIKLHPQEGALSILAASGVGQEVAAAIALEHHARFDGAGYPKLGHGDGHAHTHGDDHAHDGDASNGLSYYSRLVSVADTYDAITTRRSYRRAETPNRALHVLLNGAGTSYDPDFVRAFIHVMGVYPPGSLLQMSDGSVVMVTGHAADEPGRPSVVVVTDVAGVLIENPEPVAFARESVVDQLLPGRVGIDPASLLELIGVRNALAA